MTKREKRDKRIVRALRNDPNPKEVATDVGCHISTVYRVIDRSGLDLDLLRELKDAPAKVEALTYRMLMACDIPQKEIARRAGVSESYVSQKLTAARSKSTSGEAQKRVA